MEPVTFRQQPSNHLLDMLLFIEVWNNEAWNNDEDRPEDVLVSRNHAVRLKWTARCRLMTQDVRGVKKPGYDELKAGIGPPRAPGTPSGCWPVRYVEVPRRSVRA